MAVSTPKTYRNQIVYSVYVRNHTAEGTFEGVRQDLDRIKSLGTDIIWLMPIHPTGEKSRKGTLGSPYAIRDYRAINPEFGTLADFQRLVEEIHQKGMKCIIDVVYNHTSPDSWLAEHHPEWFYRKPDGSFGNHIGDWWDIIDLDYTKRELWDYQIETLKYWAGFVDGFRCDVASLVPLEFWRKAREEVETVRPGCIWLSESVEGEFIQAARAMGLNALSDSEIFQAFDVSYDYDVFPVFKDYVEGKVPLSRYAEAVNGQESIYPDNYVKLRYLENHDNLRAGFLFPDVEALENWTAFLYFQKGMTLIYGGQEVSCTHLPSLFDRDTVDWTSQPDRSEQLRRLARLKKHPLLTDSGYHLEALEGDILYGVHRRGENRLIGVFTLKGTHRTVAVDAPDGVYENLADGGTVEVKFGKVSARGKPLIFEV